MEIGAGPVEQTDDRGVDVPHLVGSRRAQPDLRFHGMHAEPGPAPAVLPDEAGPGGGLGPDRAEPLGEDCERAGRDGDDTSWAEGRTGPHVPDPMTDGASASGVGLHQEIAVAYVMMRL